MSEFIIPPWERWLPVVGHEGYYEVSDYGRVRSVDRIVRSRGGTRLVKSKIKELTPGWGGYLQTQLYRNNQLWPVRVHTLVLEAFISPKPGGFEGCHANGRAWDNRLNNLYWGTHSQNELDKVRHGGHHLASRTRCPRAHKLVLPNLVTHILAAGGRSCLACARARAEQQRAKHHGYVFDFKVAADRHYAKIMQEAV